MGGGCCFKEGKSGKSLLKDVTFDQTWGKPRSKPHRNQAGMHLGGGKLKCKGPEAGRMSLRVWGTERLTGLLPSSQSREWKK